MNVPVKIGIAIATLGGVSGLGYAIQQHLQSTNDIASKLIKEKYELLGEGDDWAPILASYKTTVTTDTSLKFGEFSGNDLSELKRLCNKSKVADLSKDTNGAIFKRTKKWCTKPKTLTQVLEVENYKVLNSSESGDHDTAEWDKKLDAHNDKTKNNNKKFKSLDLLTSGNLVKNSETRNKLRAKCREIEGKKHYEKEFETIKEQAVLWCSINLN